MSESEGYGKSKFTLTDRLVIFYNLILMIHIGVSADKINGDLILLLSHGIILLGIWRLAKLDPYGQSLPGQNPRDLEKIIPQIRNPLSSRANFFFWLHQWYPLLLLIWFYPETGLLRHTVISEDLDSRLFQWESFLFPHYYYITLPLSLSPYVLEFLHACYFSYYLILFVPGIFAFKRQADLVRQYLFVVMGALLAHFWLAILFPASGPTFLRKEILPDGVIFIPLMNLIYDSMDKGGAAFPSTHIVGILIASFYAGRFFPRWKLLFIVWFCLIGVSTVACTFHYTIDIIAGMVTGIVSIAIFEKIYFSVQK